MGETSDDEDSGGGSQSGASMKSVDLDIGPTLKRLLEQDHDLIVNKNKVTFIASLHRSFLVLRTD